MTNQELIEKLKQMLKELFQFENNDLDFGIYRIINIKRKEISDFIEKELFDIIKKEARTVKNNQHLKKELEDLQKEIEKTFGCSINDAIKKDNETLKIKEFFEKKKEFEKQSAEIEAEEEIYNNIINFFSRYYDNGDFISKRRYSLKKKYAIPYNGEEVYLHWANYDQYYIKTAEIFKNYSFKLEKYKVNFEITNDEVDIEKGNIKDLETKFFIFNKLKSPVKDVLNFSFEYRGLTEEETEKITGEIRKKKKTKAKKPQIGRDELNDYNYQNMLQEIQLLNPSSLTSLSKKHLNLNGDLSEKSELYWNLKKYTTKYTSDYFIHKNLKNYLMQELEFFIKNEIFQIDDIESIDKFNINLLAIITFKKISKIIIAFLAQIEDFQKNLWEKKKFVISTDYCITLDFIDEKYYPEIINNKEQLEEWQKLFSFDLSEKMKSSGNLLEYVNNNEIEILKRYKTLLIDTKFFDSEFKYKILSEFDNLERNITGILINSENFHALNLLLKKYKEKIKCCYIDPPYNTNATQIIYKNSYRDSSWISLMERSLFFVPGLLTEDGLLEVAIDDTEFRYLNILLEQIFGKSNFISNIPIMHNPRGRSDDKFIATSHEYLELYARDINKLRTYSLTQDSETIRKKYPKHDKISRYRELPLQRSGSNSRRQDRPNLYYPIYYSVDENRLSLKKENENFIEILPLDTKGNERVWRWGKNTVDEAFATEIIVKEVNNSYKLYTKDREKVEIKPKSLWYGPRYDASSHGTVLLQKMFGESVFDYPKSIFAVKDAIQIGSSSGFILDYFAGSGTTGHAIILLNKEDQGCRKFILIEMGQYFENVLKKRILKAIYSENWKNGKPQDNNGSEKQIIKYQSLEQYEDSLNNIEFKIPNSLALNSKDYKIKYMLDFETKESNIFLNIDLLDNPFEYKLDIEEKNETKTFNIDIIETFNYTAGIFVDKIIKKQDNNIDYIFVKGQKDEKKVLVIWRNKDKSFDPERDKEFVEKEIIADTEYDEIFVNGSSLIENAISLDGIFKKSMLGE